MAYDKIIVIHSRLDRCLDYVQNDGKTDLGNAVDYICNPDKAGFQTAINCTLDKSFLQMQETKRRWDKHGGILGYHIIHSYAPGEVTPEQAHEAGVEFARRLLGDKYEAVVCTHTDRDHCIVTLFSIPFHSWTAKSTGVISKAISTICAAFLMRSAGNADTP